MAACGPVTVKLHGAGCCAITTCRSATETEACRLTGSGFSVIRYDTLPSPWPSTAVVKTIQLTGEVARHEHSRATAIASVPVPPAELNWADGVETVPSHRADAGVVTLVDVEAELPQPYASVASAATANS